MEQFDPPALGVMYLNTETHELTPVVYVPDINTTCIEGSCGSGSASTAYYLATRDANKEQTSNHTQEDANPEQASNHTYEYEIKQPAGTIHASCVITNGEPSALYIEGPVDLSDPEFITIEYESAEDEISAMSNTW
jgi:hypothetical protein